MRTRFIRGINPSAQAHNTRSSRQWPRCPLSAQRLFFDRHPLRNSCWPCALPDTCEVTTASLFSPSSPPSFDGSGTSAEIDRRILGSCGVSQDGQAIHLCTPSERVRKRASTQERASTVTQWRQREGRDKPVHPRIVARGVFNWEAAPMAPLDLGYSVSCRIIITAMGWPVAAPTDSIYLAGTGSCLRCTPPLPSGGVTVPSTAFHPLSPRSWRGPMMRLNW